MPLSHSVAARRPPPPPPLRRMVVFRAMPWGLEVRVRGFEAKGIFKTQIFEELKYEHYEQCLRYDVIRDLHLFIEDDFSNVLEEWELMHEDGKFVQVCAGDATWVRPATSAPV